jgi:hypothetical protein
LPPDPFDPLTEEWPSGKRLWRCHSLDRRGNAYNATDSPGRFRPIPRGRRSFVPTAYAGDSIDAAISEGPFHDLPITAGPKYLARAVVDPLALSPLVCGRDLALISLRGHGLRRLGATQGNLIEPGPDQYQATIAWGTAAYRWPGDADGMLWVSRQFPGGSALMLFGDRVGSALRLDGQPLPLASGQGFEFLARAANAANVTIASA